MTRKTIQVFTDGAARGNPGPAGIGVVIDIEGQAVLEISDYIGKTTNNVAEYLAFIRGLEEVLLMGKNDAEFFTDSELLVKQINREYKVKAEHILPLYNHAKTLIHKFKRFSITHTKRDGNKVADKLANEGIDKLNNHPIK